MKHIVATVLLLLSLAGPATANSRLRVEDAWIRQPPPGSDVAAGYLRVHNPGATPVTITGVESPLAARAMIHETVTSGGQTRMRHRERLEIEPGGTLVLAPGGLHVMLHGLERRLEVGDTVPLVLLLSTGERLTVSAQVRPIGAR